jgi:ABC-type sugar transport system permease subunit
MAVTSLRARGETRGNTHLHARVARKLQLVRRRAWTLAFIVPFLAFFGVFHLYPTVNAFVESFKCNVATAPGWCGLTNYRYVWTNSIWLTSLYNTVVFSIISTLISVVVAIVAASLVAKNTRLNRLLRSMWFFPSILSVSVVTVIFSSLFATNLGWVSEILSLLHVSSPNLLGSGLVITSLAAVSSWWTFGIPMLILVAAMTQIPEGVRDAAAIDGAVGVRYVWHVVLPLVRSAIVVVVILQFSNAFRAFALPYILTKGGPGLSSFFVMLYYNANAFMSYHLGLGNAIGYSIAVPIGIVSAIYVRFLRRRGI